MTGSSTATMTAAGRLLIIRIRDQTGRATPLGSAFHPNGMNVQMCDGSGSWVGWDIDLRIFAYMASIAGGESESDPLPP